MGNISDLTVYSRGTVGISHHKKSDLAYTMTFWKGIELEVFWIGIKEERLQNEEIEKKFAVMLTAASKCFAVLPAL